MCPRANSYFIFHSHSKHFICCRCFLLICFRYWSLLGNLIRQPSGGAEYGQAYVIRSSSEACFDVLCLKRWSFLLKLSVHPDGSSHTNGLLSSCKLWKCRVSLFCLTNSLSHCEHLKVFFSVLEFLVLLDLLLSYY